MELIRWHAFGLPDADLKVLVMDEENDIFVAHHDGNGWCISDPFGEKYCSRYPIVAWAEVSGPANLFSGGLGPIVEKAKDWEQIDYVYLVLRQTEREYEYLATEYQREQDWRCELQEIVKDLEKERQKLENSIWHLEIM